MLLELSQHSRASRKLTNGIRFAIIRRLITARLEIDFEQGVATGIRAKMDAMCRQVLPPPQNSEGGVGFSRGRGTDETNLWTVQQLMMIMSHPSSRSLIINNREESDDEDVWNTCSHSFSISYQYCVQ